MTDQSSAAALKAKRGRGRPTGPGLRKLLTQKFPDGASMADLIGAGFTGEINRYLATGEIEMDAEGVFRWIKPIESAETAPAVKPNSTTENEPRGEVVRYVRIDEIEIGPRYRKDPLHEIDKLRDSVSEVGLLQPIGITRDKKLVFGQRRIEAFKLLGRDTIQARIIPIESIVRGEHDENECRLNFTVSERVAILQAIGRKPEGRPTGYSADLPSYADAAKLANFESERTARNAEKVVAAGSPELVEAMDKGGLSIDAAAVIAKQPAEVQRTIVQAPKPERKAAVSKLRKPKVLPSPSAFYVPAPPSTELDAQKDRQGTSVRLVPWDRAANKAAFAEANWLKSDLQALRDDIDEIINTPVLQ